MTYWFDRVPGQFVAVSNEEDPRTESVVMLYGANSPPDWVKIPPGLPGLSGRQVRVSDSFTKQCVKCASPTPCTHLVLDEVDMNVCECLSGCGFVFYRLRKRENDAEGG